MAVASPDSLPWLINDDNSCFQTLHLMFCHNPMITNDPTMQLVTGNPEKANYYVTPLLTMCNREF